MSWDELTWEDDDWCWYTVAHHPDGLTQEEVAQVTGWSPARVHALEQSALAKLRRRGDARECFDKLKGARQRCDQLPRASVMSAE